MADITMPMTAGVQSSAARERIEQQALIAIVVLIASTFTVILNEMMMAVALPRVMVDLDITASTGQWLTTGYMLTMAVVIPATGFLTERFRMRTVYTIAMTLFTAGTLIAIVAPGFSVLLIGRIVQAVGTAIATPLAFTAVTALVPQSRRGQMMAFLTIATSAAPAFGPAIAGSILSVAGWRWLFIAILPIAVVCLVVGNQMIRVPSTPRIAKVDVLSVLLAAIGFAGVVYGLASFGEGSDEHAMGSPWLIMAIGMIFVALFAARQINLQKYNRALLDMRPFRDRTFATATLLAALFMTAATGMMTLMPVMLQTSYGLTPLQTGLFMLPGGLTITMVSAVVGHFYDRIGPRSWMITGTIIDAAGLYYLSTLASGTPIPVLLATYMFIIVGQACLYTPALAASLGSLNKQLLPHGSAIMNTIQQLTGAAGIAIVFSVMTTAGAGYVADGETVGPAMAHGAQQAYLVVCAMVVVGFFTALAMPKTKTTAGNGGPLAVH